MSEEFLTNARLQTMEQNIRDIATSVNDLKLQVVTLIQSSTSSSEKSLHSLDVRLTRLEERAVYSVQRMDSQHDEYKSLLSRVWDNATRVSGVLAVVYIIIEQIGGP